MGAPPVMEVRKGVVNSVKEQKHYHLLLNLKVQAQKNVAGKWFAWVQVGVSSSQMWFGFWTRGHPAAKVHSHPLTFSTWLHWLDDVGVEKTYKKL